MTANDPATNTVVTELVRSAVENAAGHALDLPKISQPTEVSVANRVINALKADPVFANETNSESALQSRVFWGSLAGGLSGLAILFTQFGACSFDVICYSTNWAVVGPALTAVGGAGYALYGRFVSGLKPLGRGSEPSLADPKKV